MAEVGPKEETGGKACPFSGGGDGGEREGRVKRACEVYGRLRPEREGRSLAEQALAFFDLLEMEEGGPGVDAGRRGEVLREIGRHGFYEHTAEELLWGARFAWRHSVRCVGRFFWNQLEMFDARGVASVPEVAERCLQHIREATNGGKIRSLITIFAPEHRERHFRIGNHQLLRYAGHHLGEGGGILGDPAEAEFTAFCKQHGWAEAVEATRFDVLPLAVFEEGANGAGGPHFFEIPRAMVPEVAIVHPELEWFGELGLRWYAVPILSDMVLEIGGIRYPAAPFNGWYMGTEIGARNLGDAGRYDMLPQIAERMGIHARKEGSLWRDRALVELNRAVLHSFQEAGVRMIDHHTAGHLHLRFEEEEVLQGRPVTGRWDWLVPPVSGSTSPLWGRTYDATEYSPNFLYQTPVWRG